MFELKLRLPTFLVLLLIRTILSVPVDFNNDSKDCEKLHTCSLNLKSSSYVEANKKLTQSSSISSQHKETNIVAVGDATLIDNKADKNNKILTDLLAKLPEHETTHIKSTRDAALLYTNHAGINSELPQSLQQVLARSSEHEITLGNSGHDHVQPHEVSGYVNYGSTSVGHQSRDSNEQKTQLLLQLEAPSPKHKITVIKSEGDHVQPNENYELTTPKHKSLDAKRQLVEVLQKLLAHRSMHQSDNLAPHENSGDANNQLKQQNQIHDSNEPLSQISLQLQNHSPKHEIIADKSKRIHTVPHERSDDSSLAQVVEQVLAHRSNHERESITPNGNSVDANNQLKKQHQSQDSNEQLTQVLLQLQAHLPTHKLTTVKSGRFHMVHHDNSDDTSDNNNQMKKQHKSDDTNEQLTQLLLQLQSPLPKQEVTAVKSEHVHVVPNARSDDTSYESTKVEHKSLDVERQLAQVLEQVLAHRSTHERESITPNGNSGDANNQLKKQHESHDTNEQLTRLLLQLEPHLPKHEITVEKSEHVHTVPHERSDETSYESTKVEPKSHDAERQLAQVLEQVLAHRSTHERESITPNGNSGDASNQMKKQHQSHDSNEQLTQLLLQLPAQSPTHSITVIRSESGHAVPQGNSDNTNTHSQDSNEQSTQLLLQLQAHLPKHEITTVKSERDHAEPHESSDDTSYEVEQNTNKQLVQVLQQILANRAKPESGHVQPHENSGNTNFELTTLKHKSHDAKRRLVEVLQKVLAHRSKHESDSVTPHGNSDNANNQLKKQHQSHDSNEQLTRLLLQLLAQSLQHETTTVKTEGDHVSAHGNSGETSYESTTIDHKSQDINRQLVQVLQQVLAHSSKYESDQVITHENSNNIKNDLLNLLVELYKHKSIKVKQTTNDDSNIHLTQFVQQPLAKSNGHELILVKSKIDYKLPQLTTDQNPIIDLPKQELPHKQLVHNNERPGENAVAVETSPKLIPTVTGLVKHQLDDVEGTLGKVTSILG